MGMNKITKKNLTWAQKQLKPIKIKTVSGGEFTIEVYSRERVAKILEVSRQAIYLAEKDNHTTI